MTAELEDSTALRGQGPHLCVPGVSITVPSSSKSQRGGDRIRTGEANPGLLVLLFPYPLKGDGYKAPGEGTAVGEQGRWTALQVGLASAWS